MLSFSILSVLALAFAAVTSAVPVEPAGTSALQTQGLDVILSDATTRIGPICAELEYVVVGNATYVILEPVLDELKSVLVQTIGAVQALTKAPLPTILGTLTIPGLAQLLAALILTIYTALGAVLKTVAAAEYTLVFPLLCDVGALVGELLKAVLILVVGLLAVILPLLAGIVDVVIHLNVVYILGLLNV